MAMGINLCVSLDLQAVEIEFDAKIWLLILNMLMLRIVASTRGFFFFFFFFRINRKIIEYTTDPLLFG